MKLSNYVEQISDDFQSTFTATEENTLCNMLQGPHEFDKVIKIIQKYIPGAKLEFIKSDQIAGDYDIYVIKLVGIEQ